MCLLYSVLSFAAVVICAETEVPVRAIAHLIFEYPSAVLSKAYPYAFLAIGLMDSALLVLAQG